MPVETFMGMPVWVGIDTSTSTTDSTVHAVPDITEEQLQNFRRVLVEATININNNLYGMMATPNFYFKLKYAPVKNWKKRIEQR